jgi:amino acid permease
VFRIGSVLCFYDNDIDLSYFVTQFLELFTYLTKLASTFMKFLANFLGVE